MNSDAELLARYVRNNSNAAFAELVQRHMGMVYGAALRQLSGAQHLAEDVVQTVFVALARKARTLQHRQTLAGWLYLSTHHAAAQLARTESRRRRREETHTMEEQLANDTSPEWHRIQELLDPTLRQLREEDRDAVLLRYVEGRSFAEIGAAFRISADAARMRVDRALDRLRDLLEQRGITSTGAALGAVLSSHAAPLPAAAFASRVSQVAAAIRATDPALPASGAWAAVAAVAAIGIGTGIYYAHRSETHRADLRTAAQQRDDALAQLATARDDARALQQQLEVVRATAPEPASAVRTTRVDTPAAAPSAANQSPAPKVGAWTFTTTDGRPLGTNYFVDSPAGRRENIRTAVAHRYAPYFQKMGWSPDQQAIFADLFFEKKEAAQVSMKGSFGAGNPPSRDALRDLVQRTEIDFELKLAEVFGPRAVEVKRDFEAKIPFRNVTDELAKRLFHSATPLVSWQADQLIDLMANSSRTATGRFDIRAMDNHVVLNQAQAFLSAPQLAAYRELDAEKRRQDELEQRMLSERGALPRDAAPTP